MVTMSVLPGRGMSELSAMPNKMRPGPPRWISQCMALFSVTSRAMASQTLILIRTHLRLVSCNLITYRLGRDKNLQKSQVGCSRQGSNFRGQTVIKLKPFEARRVEIIMDILCQIDANHLDVEAEARRPLLRQGFEISWRQAVIARLSENAGDRLAVSTFEGLLADGPEGENEGFSRALHPLFRQVESEVASAVDL